MPAGNLPSFLSPLHEGPVRNLSPMRYHRPRSASPAFRARTRTTIEESLLITGEVRNQVDRLWDAFWSGGIC